MRHSRLQTVRLFMSLPVLTVPRPTRPLALHRATARVALAEQPRTRHWLCRLW